MKTTAIVSASLLVGALAGYAVTAESGSPWIGLLGAAIGGALLASVHGFFVLWRRTNQLATGLVVLFLALGLTSLFGVDYVQSTINAFEKMLSDEGTTILKFFLHISKEEQKQRLEARLADPAKNWKFNPDDLAERKRWDEYRSAYEDALEKCSTDAAPWYIVPADHKWFRNWLVSDVIVRAMQDLKLKYPRPPEGIENWKVK
jgi:hypothetical protein